MFGGGTDAGPDVVVWSAFEVADVGGGRGEARGGGAFGWRAVSI